MDGVSPGLVGGGSKTYVAEHEEEDVDDGVDGANAAFDPDCDSPVSLATC